MPGMVLPPEREPIVPKKRTVGVDVVVDLPQIVQKETTIPDTGPISRRKGSVVNVVPPKRTR